MRATWVRAGVLVALLLAGVVAALTVDLPDVDAVRRWLDGSGPAGVLLLTAGVGLALVGPVPRTALPLLLGVVLGFWGGVAVGLAGGVLGGLAAFALARLLGREAVTRLTGPRLQTVDRWLDDRGVLAVALLRLAPVPYALGSYAAGLTGIGLGTFTAGTAVGIVPGTVVQVGLGATAGQLTEWAASRGGLVVEGAVVVAVAVGGLVWWRLRRRTARTGGDVAGEG